ncbi:MAG: hypothetical protein KAR84_00935 [Elusimicrobiales bacterium]|nr:hypothetical protein [Elusimicrobiales bacterium]MCK5584327.1 hypothetical protein [Elusimicrobiales bacterium]
MHLTFILLLGITTQAADKPVTVEVSTPTLTVEQVYRPVTLRDPMVVSNVFGDQKPWPSVKVSEVSKTTFSIYNLSLSGIMEDSSGKQAMLKDKNTRQTYILRFGKLVDGKKKTVKGVTGVIKGKQVILMTEDKKIFPINLREKE